MTFGQIRFIKRMLFVLFLGILGYVSYFVWLGVKGRDAASMENVDEPVDAVSREIQIEQLDSEGETAWTLKAAESVGRTESSQSFRSVEIRFNVDDEGVPVVVTADECEVRQDDSVHLEGNVVVRDETSLRLEAQTLDFRRRPDRIWTTQPVRYFREGMSGTAGNMRYFTYRGDLILGEGVSMVLQQDTDAPVRIESQSASMRRDEHVIQYVDGVRVRQTNRALDCNDLQIYLTEDNAVIEHIEAYEKVDLRMNVADTRGVAEEPDEDEPAKQAEDPPGRQDLLAEPGSKRLLTDRLEMILRPGGEYLERARALEGGRLVLDLPEGVRDGYRKELEGYTLAFEFDELGRLVLLRGRGGIKLVLTPPEGSAAEKKVVTARQLESDFDPETGDLVEARCSRAVTFEQGEVRAEAEEGTFIAAQSLLVLEEDPKLWDRDARLEGDTLRINTDSGDIEGIGHVQSTSARSGEKGGLFPSTPEERDAPVYFVSDHLEYGSKDDVAVYTGSARALKGPNRIEADRIEVRQRLGQLEAKGNVRTIFVQKPPATKGAEAKPSSPTVTHAASLAYDSATEVLQYRERVEMRSEDMTLRGRSLDVSLEEAGQEIREMFAEGNVEIQTKDGKAAGDTARYLPKEDSLTVTGESAWLENAGKVTEGKQLIFFLTDDRVFVDGREQNRTKTTYSSQPPPF